MSFRVALAAAAACAAAVWSASPAAAAPSPISWCGTDRATANRTPDTEALSSPNLVHVVYATPSDGPDRFGALAPAIATDVSAIDAWWRTQDGSRTPRFDLFSFPGCSTRFGNLDLSFTRLPRPASAYLGNGRVSAIASDLAPVAPNFKSLVYYDGPVADRTSSCGTSPIAPRSGGRDATSVVWLQADCPADAGQGRYAASVAAHELLHNLGAVDPGRAPHECPAPNSGHACDSPLDIMYPFLGPGSFLDAMRLDVGHDDYYAHGGTAFDVQDSAWLMRLPLFPVAIEIAGNGTVSSALGALACPTTCTPSIENGTRLTLVAHPAGGQRLVAWGGACSGRAGCTVSVTAAQTVTATFGRASVVLAVRITGRGRVTSTPAGISCVRSCSRPFAADRSVRLRARPAAGFRLTRWTGSCRGAGACVVRTDRPRTVGAVFARVARS